MSQTNDPITYFRDLARTRFGLESEPRQSRKRLRRRRLASRSKAFQKMGRLRFELRTNRLKAECSTAELATRCLDDPCCTQRFRQAPSRWLRAPEERITRPSPCRKLLGPCRAVHRPCCGRQGFWACRSARLHPAVRTASAVLLQQAPLVAWQCAWLWPGAVMSP